MATPEDIHAFWFGPEPLQKREEWFKGGPAFDDACRRFEADWKAARAGDLDHWLEQPKSLVAFVVLTDQIPRNLFREDDRQFAADPQALAAAEKATSLGWDKAMHEFERVFLYLPYEHSEDMAMQDKSVALYGTFENKEWLPFAEAHRDLIARFGRFPHRNTFLGRTSTAEEIAFMEEHGRGF